jgi:hypothetical protein
MSPAVVTSLMLEAQADGFLTWRITVLQQVVRISGDDAARSKMKA